MKQLTSVEMNLSKQKSLLNLESQVLIKTAGKKTSARFQKYHKIWYYKYSALSYLQQLKYLNSKSSLVIYYIYKNSTGDYQIIASNLSGLLTNPDSF